MPELPEVEYTARQLRASVLGATIKGAQVFWERSVGAPAATTFCALITGQRVLQVRRRGKYLLFDLGRTALPELLMTLHRRMTGNLYLLPPGWHIDTRASTLDPAAWATRGPQFQYHAPPRSQQEPAEPVHTAELSHCRVCFDLADGRRLLFTDPRKFGRIELWPAEHEEEALAGLGPEPLSADFTADVLSQRLSARKGPIKTALLAQETVAGLGNIYADEALFLACIHPLRPANSLKVEELHRLHTAIVAVLSLGIEHGGTTFSGYRSLQGESGEHYAHLKAYHKAGDSKHCCRCGNAIASRAIAQRTAHYCPQCQTL
jgi:formamidopyrimidine-DNA glycosylase